MRVFALTVLALQALVMLVDELHFHRRRQLPRWERIGHPLDTLSVLACCVVSLSVAPTPTALMAYALLATLSCLLVTKDEFVHAQHCEPGEHWLHALLFVLHPLLLIALALLWLENARRLLLLQTLATAGFGVYQAVYWNIVAKSVRAPNERRERARTRAPHRAPAE